MKRFELTILILFSWILPDAPVFCHVPMNNHTSSIELRGTKVNATNTSENTVSTPAKIIKKSIDRQLLALNVMQAPNIETDITLFSFAEQSAAIVPNTTTHTVDIEVVYGTSLLSLTPTIQLSLGATISPLSGIAQNFTNPVNYIVTAEDGITEQIWTVNVTVAANIATDITAFSFPEQTAPAILNAATHTVAIEVAYGTGLNSLTPTIVVSAGATVAPLSGVAQNFTNTVNYTVTAEDGTTKQVWKVNATVAANNATDITAFSFPEQAAPAILNTTTHTVTIKVAYGTSLTSLKPTIAVSAGATIAPLSGVTQNFTNPVNYNVTAEDGITSQLWAVNVTVVPNIATDITAFSFVQQTGPATPNATTHTVDIQLAYGTSLTSLIPTISVSAGATISPLSGVAQNFTSTVNYTVTAEDGITSQEWKVSATVAANTATDIISFSFPQQTKVTIPNATTHTVDLEVVYGTILNSLTPTITVSAGATISPLSGVAKDFGKEVNYLVTAQDGTTKQGWKVNVTVAANTATDIISFSFPEQTKVSIPNTTTHTVDLEVSYGTSLTSLKPTITVSKGATISPLSGVNQNFTNTVNYTLTAEDGITSQVWKVNVTVAANIATDIISFSLAQQTAPAILNTSNHTVAIKVVYGTNLTSLIPSISVSPGATISPLSGVSQNFDGTVNYTVTAEDGFTKQVWKVNVSMAANSATDITAFSFPEQTAPAILNTANHTVAIEVAYGTNLASLTPTIAVSAGATITPLSGVTKDFKKEVNYTVTAEDGITKQGWKVNVTEAANTATDITTFSFIEQTAPATPNTSNHTVNIEVAYGTSLVSLKPTITVSAGATMSPLSGVAQNFTNTVNYTVTAEDGITKQVWKVNVSVAPNKETDITSFSFAKQTAPAILNASTHTVTIKVVYGTSLTSLIPTISVSPGATISPLSGVTQNFTNTVNYAVTAEDGITKQVWKVYVTVAANTATDITIFSFAEQAAPAILNTSTHTVAIEVVYGTNLASLTPTIAVSAGATISPLSGVKQDFKKTVNYTVTADDGVTKQDWKVNVTVASNTSTDITSFSFSEQSAIAVINNSMHTVAIKVLYGTSLTSLLPTITVSAGATISPLSGIAQNFTNTVNYTVTAENGVTKQVWKVNVTVAANTATDITSFSFAEQAVAAVINTTMHTVAINVIYGTSLTSLIPTITVSEGASISPLSAVAQNFTTAVNYTVTADDGESTQIWKVNVSIAANTATDITLFSFAEQTTPAILNTANHTVAIEVVYGTNLTSLSPIIEVSPGATISPLSGVTKDFEKIVNYTVTAEDGITTQLWKVNVTMAFNTATDIILFSFAEQATAATLNTTAHIVNVEVVYGTSLSSLIPTIEVSAGATILPLSGEVQNFKKSVNYTVTAEDGITKQVWTVNVTEASNTATDITLFTFAEQTSVVIPNTTKHTVDIEVVYGTSLLSLIPTIAISAGATISPMSGVAQDFSNEVNYKVTAKDGVTTQIWTVNVTVALNTMSDITIFSFAEQTAAVIPNVTDHSIDIEVVYGTSLTSLIPTIAVSAGATISPLSGVTQNFTGPVKYTVTAEDGTTKQVWTIYATVQIDKNKPLFSNLILPSIYESGTSKVSPSFTIIENFELSSVKFYSRHFNQTDYEIEILTSPDKNYSVDLTENKITDVGLEYYFEATDVSGNISKTNQTQIVLKYIGSNGPLIPYFTPGGKSENWQMLSIPFILDDNQVETIFEIPLGTYDQTKWRIVHYENDSVKFVEYKNGLSTVERGKGYWFNSTQQVTIPMSPGMAPTNSGKNLAVLDIQKGWNQIGNPYTFDLLWENIILYNGIVDEVENNLRVLENGTSLTNSVVLKAYSGAYLFADQAIKLEVPLIGNTSGRTDNSNIPDEGWLLNMALETGTITNNISGFGMHPNARSTKDQFDQIRSPRFANYIDASFNHAEYFMPDFSRDIVPVTENYIWEFTVSTNSEKDIRKLTWNNVEIAFDKQLLLIDITNGNIIDMLENNHYSYSSENVRRFKVIYGDKDFVENQFEKNQFYLGDTYPNPFNRTTTIPFSIFGKDGNYNVKINIYSIDGRLIKTVADKQLSAGIYSVQWDGTNQSNAKITGMFFYSLEIKSSYGTNVYRKKMISQ